MTVRVAAVGGERRYAGALVAPGSAPSAEHPALCTSPSGLWVLSDALVCLMPMTEAHVPSVARAVSDPHGASMLQHYLGTCHGPEERQDQVRRMLLGPLGRDKVVFAVMARPVRPALTPKSSPLSGKWRTVGVRWLELVDDGGGELTCGGWVHRAHRGRGVGGAALRLALSYGYQVLGAEKVVTATRRDNFPAQANLARAGFRRTEDDDPLLETWAHTDRSAVTRLVITQVPRTPG